MKRGHTFHHVATLGLFALFAGSILMVLMLGAKSYQGVISATQDTFEARTCLQYLATKVSHYSQEGSVTVTTFGDGSALALTQTIDDCPYVTYLYSHDGQVKELFCEADVDLGPEAGFAILEVEGLTIQAVTPQLLRLSCESTQGTIALYVGLQNLGDTP